MITSPLVTLDYARLHTRTEFESDDDMWMKLLSATQIVMHAHLKLADIPRSWLMTTLPPDAPPYLFPQVEDTEESPPVMKYVMVHGNVQAAILLVASDLYENREAGVSKAVSDAVVALLSYYRMPSMGMYDRVGFRAKLEEEETDWPPIF